MKNFTSFDCKLYRNTLACDLKSQNKEKAKSYLSNEKVTLEYQVAKNIKVSVYHELKNILTTSNQLKTLKEVNTYLNEIDFLANKIKRNYNIFNELPKEIQLNHYLNLKLLEDDNYLYGNSDFFPQELLFSKEFILKAIKVNTDIIRFIPNEADIKNDFDIIDYISKNDSGELINLNFKQYNDILITRYPNIKNKLKKLVRSQEEKLKNEWKV